MLTSQGRPMPDAIHPPDADARRPHGRVARARLLGFCILAVSALLALVVPAQASAGTWTLVSCSQPDGQVAPTDGWTSVQLGGQQNYSGDTNSCGQPGGGLFATSSSAWPQTRGNGWMWQFNAPADTTIAGGQISLMMTS